MKIFWILSATLAAWSLAMAQDDSPERTIAITNVTLIDGTGAAPRPNTTVLVSGDRIAAILPGDERTASADETADGRGKFLIPGLWDMHVHLTYVGDVTCTTLIAYGVTSVRDAGGNLATLDWLRDLIQDGRLTGPRIFRAGPLLDGPKPGARDRLVIAAGDDGRRAVHFLKDRGVDVIKIHNGVPSAAYFAVLAEARRQGLTVMGHIPYDVDPGQAIDAGHRSVEHIVSLFEGPVRHKVAGGMSQEQAIAEFTDAVAARLARKVVAERAWFTPTLVTYWYRAHQWQARAAGDPREKYVTASMHAYWDTFDRLPDDAELRRTLSDGFDRFLDITRVLHREGVHFLVGTDLAVPLTYPGSSVHEELSWLVQAGLTSMEAIVAGTRNGAEAVGRLSELGTIEEGKLADLVLLEADPLVDISNTKRIAAVMANGRLFRREALDSMLAEIEGQAAER